MIRQIVMVQVGAVPKHLRKHMRKIMRVSLATTAGEHHKAFMALHFQFSAYQRYGSVYRPRAGAESGTGTREFFRRYAGRKLKQKGHRRPLVWSGASAILARIRDIKSNSKRARIVQHARQLNRRNPRSLVNMRAEVSAVNAQERAFDIRIMRATLIRQMNAVRDRSHKTIK